MYLTIKELSEKTKYSKHTLYKKIKIMTNGLHYFKPNNGKILFSELAVDFLVKGVQKNENKQRLDISKEGKPISAYQFVCE